MQASDMKFEECYFIKFVEDSPLQVHFLELGVSAGKSIRLLNRAPFSGAMAFEVGGNYLSMRKSEAQLIHVGKEVVNPE